ncbi:MAG TPA: NADH-quinone oxidoreductase subunit NuoH [Bryobacteraceae bacterium]|jgi:NADH-quinone oxidoreductase subunit H|nr:NADH-quinone oxidoreductase subunit NuoH [Bryobacteraceae bacterium]
MEFIIITLIKLAVIAFVLLTTLAYLQWVERKVIAHVQVRMGPYRVGPHGLLQPLADVVKLITKEGVLPPHVNRFFYLLAPFLAVLMALIPISVIPFGTSITVFGYTTNMELADLNVGILVILSLSALGVYGIALAGWSSNNKYALLGGLRSSAQMISYELPMSLAIASPLLLAGTLSLRKIVDSQAGYNLGIIPKWAIFAMPAPQIFSFIIFMIAAFAETNRIPFDLPEAENELVAGFHVEYSSMSFAAFFMAEYANMVTVCSVATLLFLGGWHPLWPAAYGSNFVAPAILLIAGGLCLYHGLNPARPLDRYTLPAFAIVFFGLAGLMLYPPTVPVLTPLFWFLAKTGFLLFVFVWIRATLPRFRYDQLMGFAWKFLFPVALANLLLTGFLVALVP